MLVGCGGSKLPSYGAPQGAVMSGEYAEGGDLIAYRTLTREDFRGTAPTGPAAKHADKIGAQTYTLVKTDPSVGFDGTERRLPNGDREIEGKVQRLVFRAWMDRSRSWWNPQPGQTPDGYTLQHEQIHFALVEIEAGKMNVEGRSLMQRTFEGESSETIQKDIQEAINEILREGNERLLERSLEFDEDTSGRYEPAKQNEWYERVQRELAAKG
jgi:hypothetical protein